MENFRVVLRLIIQRGAGTHTSHTTHGGKPWKQLSNRQHRRTEGTQMKKAKVSGQGSECWWVINLIDVPAFAGVHPFDCGSFLAQTLC